MEFRAKEWIWRGIHPEPTGLVHSKIWELLLGAGPQSRSCSLWKSKTMTTSEESLGLLQMTLSVCTKRRHGYTLVEKSRKLSKAALETWDATNGETEVQSVRQAQLKDPWAASTNVS